LVHEPLKKLQNWPVWVNFMWGPNFCASGRIFWLI
jgi:hypothetical protein